jgi:2-oxoglutarate dehydrogenase E1 component
MPGPATLQEIITHLQNIYCDSIGVEYMHIQNVEEKKWIMEWVNVNENHLIFLLRKKQKFFSN